MKSVETRIGELIGSRRYRDDFGIVRSEIMGTRDPDLPSDFAEHSGEGFEEFDEKRYATLKVGLTPSDRMTFFFAETKEEDKWRMLLPSEVKRILEENINDHLIRIHREHSWLVKRYGLRLYFDYAEFYPEGFDPFKDPEEEIAPYLRTLVKMFSIRKITQMASSYLKNPTGIRSSKEFDEDETRRVRIAVRKGLTKPKEIFFDVFPEHVGRRIFSGRKNVAVSQGDEGILKSAYLRIEKLAAVEKRNCRGLPPPKTSVPS